jgi:hypothetical protein
VYVVSAKLFSCAKADRLVPKLAAETIHLQMGVGGAILPDSPYGGECSGLPDANHHAYYGYCVAGVGVGPEGTVGGPLRFQWGPKGLNQPPPAKVDTPSSTVTGATFPVK